MELETAILLARREIELKEVQLAYDPGSIVGLSGDDLVFSDAVLNSRTGLLFPKSKAIPKKYDDAVDVSRLGSFGGRYLNLFLLSNKRVAAYDLFPPMEERSLRVWPGGRPAEENVIKLPALGPEEYWFSVKKASPKEDSIILCAKASKPHDELEINTLDIDSGATETLFRHAPLASFVYTSSGVLISKISGQTLRFEIRKHSDQSMTSVSFGAETLPEFGNFFSFDGQVCYLNDQTFSPARMIFFDTNAFSPTFRAARLWDTGKSNEHLEIVGGITLEPNRYAILTKSRELLLIDWKELVPRIIRCDLFRSDNGVRRRLTTVKGNVSELSDTTMCFDSTRGELLIKMRNCYKLTSQSLFDILDQHDGK